MSDRDRNRRAAFLGAGGKLDPCTISGDARDVVDGDRYERFLLRLLVLLEFSENNDSIRTARVLEVRILQV